MALNVVFCWSDISGYMAACWRSLQQQPDVNLTIIAFQSHSATAFADDLMEDIPCQLLTAEQQSNTQLIKQLVKAANPDIVVLCGWLHPPYRQLAFDSALRHVKFIMGMDTPWWGTSKQRLAPFALRTYLKRMSHVVVTGERSWQYARRLGFSSSQIMRGLYGIDYEAWSPLYEHRQQLWPHSFLFVGRYTNVKAIDVLVEAYQAYRRLTSDPWPLVCCGKGELASLLDQPGIQNLGFVQPSDMTKIWQQAGAFIMPSRFDPWPLAIVEAAAAGLPIVCTEVCGSAVEVVRPWHNGLLVAEDSAASLTQALLALHQQHDSLPKWGKRSQQMAAPYSAALWTTRWMALFQQLTPSVDQSAPKSSSSKAAA